MKSFIFPTIICLPAVASSGIAWFSIFLSDFSTTFCILRCVQAQQNILCINLFSKIPLSVNNVPIIVLCFIQVLGCRFAVPWVHSEFDFGAHWSDSPETPDWVWSNDLINMYNFCVKNNCVNIEQNTGTAPVMSAVL